MKKLLSLLLALVLVFSLVACSTNEKPKDDTAKETVEEPATDTTKGKTEEPAKEHPKEETPTEKSDVVEVTTYALSENLVLATAEGLDQKVVKLEAGNQDSLLVGHKYTFTLDGVTEFADPLAVKEATMEGKPIKVTLDPSLVKEVVEKVPTAKLVDTRTEEEFAAGSPAEINISSAKVAELSALEDKGAALGEYLAPLLEQFSKEDVAVLVGSEDHSKVTEILYKQAKVPLQLDGGVVVE